MSKRKHNAYTLWLKWNDVGWRPEFTVKDTGNANPRKVCKEYFKWRFAPHEAWNWNMIMVLPEGRTPKERN